MTYSHSLLPMCHQLRISSVAFQCGRQHGRTRNRQSRIPRLCQRQVARLGVASCQFSRRSELHSTRNRQLPERLPLNPEQEPEKQKAEQPMLFWACRNLFLVTSSMYVTCLRHLPFQRICSNTERHNHSTRTGKAKS